MKHIKTFENNNQSLWMYINIPTENPDIYEVVLLKDKESAEDYFIFAVNEIAFSDGYYDDDHNYDKIYVSTLDEAKSYVDENEYNIHISTIGQPFKYYLPEEIEIAKNTKKYNL